MVKFVLMYQWNFNQLPKTHDRERTGDTQSPLVRLLDQETLASEEREGLALDLPHLPPVAWEPEPDRDHR